MFAKIYEMKIIQSRFDAINGDAGSHQLYSRKEFIDALMWLDEQESIDREIANETKIGSSNNS